MDSGAPAAHLLASEYRAALCYYLSDAPANWDGSTIHLRDAGADTSPMVLVKLDGVQRIATSENGPNHEHFGLFEIVCEIKNSRWLKQSASDDCKHLVFVFHDRTFEFICRSFERTVVDASAYELIEPMREFVFE